MSSFLQLDEYPDTGVTLIVGPQWMFLAPMYRPYHIEKEIEIEGGKDFDEQVPIYHDGFAFAGILNLQDCVQEWPATAGIGIKKHGVVDSLVHQSTPEDNQEEETKSNQ